ncbi:hypothetical protein PROFUN_02949 [Planoprotostelium fungivorum]|uniref:HPP transmembrane region domain-containing protein n=1 Tax=Planoprotostelium fungivorum TaxID=1890364 RepID=A0A2P6NXB3_9EUKA|nr:hypothetical protein PROFUN_02949 [Planoprotostelium fungivorum]
MKNLNQMLPKKNIFSHLPPMISRFFGYRKEKPKPLPILLTIFWSFIGAFGGVSVVEAIFSRGPVFIERGVPMIVGSFGATAVLIYGAIDSPLAQPRNVMGGHIIASVIGVSITKLFDINYDGSIEDLRWLNGALACAVTIALTQFTKTVHPPAGATALLAATNDPIRRVGWYYIPVVILSAVVMLAVALIVNNIQRRYPIYWWSPVKPVVTNVSQDMEMKPTESKAETVVEVPDDHRSSEVITISGTTVRLPPGLILSPEEVDEDMIACQPTDVVQEQLLKGLQNKLNGYDVKEQ